MALDIKRKGMLLIISGPAGAGKGTFIKMLKDSDPSFRFSCSVTTRKPRTGEVDGIDYHFVDEAEFQRLVDENVFLEHAVVHGHRYGSLRSEVEQTLADGGNILLDVDPQGAMNIMKVAREYVSVFIMPPSFQELRTRLHSRNTDDEAEIERRLINARGEVKTVGHYQYVVVNDNKELAFAQLQCIVTAEKQRTTRFYPVVIE